jgi:HTH-type transcriptional regulator / antitoxin HipB
VTFSLYTPREVAERLGERLMSVRLARNMKRATLAERAGVSESTIKRFESTGQITLDNLLGLALALDCLDQFDALFTAPPVTSIAELERLAGPPERKRGRR